MATVTQHSHGSAPETKECFSFTLILSGFDEITSEIENALYDAGCSDALLGLHAGTPFLAFDREANSLNEAIRSAIQDVEKSGQKIEVVRVIPAGQDTIDVFNAILKMRRQVHRQFHKEKAAEELVRRIDEILCALSESDSRHLRQLFREQD